MLVDARRRGLAAGAVAVHRAGRRNHRGIAATIGGFFGIWVFIDLIMILIGKFSDKDGNALAR